MLMQLAVTIFWASPHPPPGIPSPGPVIEWCGRASNWADTQVVAGAFYWTLEVSLSYVPASGTLLVFGNLSNGGVGNTVSLYLPLPYPCVQVDPASSIPIVNWADYAFGWLHASVLKPPGVPWPEAMDANAVVLLIQ
ncbi:MAG TPA: hypothetical protein VFI25_02180 [Planctomycetota bacterium]|jgi:hypothetical protein|nr:hypothetical protein [Planctomycetota bacterium]